MEKKVILVGELHQDLFYSTDFFTNLSQSLAHWLISQFKEIEQSIIKNSPEELKKKILSVINDTPKKIGGETYIKRGGNGNNSAMLINNLGIPTQLMTTIGSGHEWILPEMEKLGIETKTIFKVEDKGPISTIIEDPNITKIFVAPNLKENMNFEKVNITENDFKDAKIVFITPLADKYANILQILSNLDVISAVTIETQKIENKTQLEKYYQAKTDLLFANLNDLALILGNDISDNSEAAIHKRLIEMDDVFQQYATVRVYTLGKYGAWVSSMESIPKTIINVPIIPAEVKNRTGAGDTFAAGFISYLYNHCSGKKEFSSLAQDELNNLLKKSAEYATAAATLKVSTGNAPDKKQLENFYRDTYR